MTRVESWNPNKFDEIFEDIAIDRLVNAAEFVAENVRTKLNSKIGTGKTTGISRPVYKSGPYAGQIWTKRDFGSLLNSVRVVRKRTKSLKAFTRKRNVRVYCGNFLAYYARIFEYKNPFMRPAYYQSLGGVKQIVGAK